MKTSLALIAAAALALCACESTTPAQRYAQAQQVVAQAYGNKLSPSQQAALATAIYQQAEATRAAQQAQAAAIMAQGIQQASANYAAAVQNRPPMYFPPTVYPAPVPITGPGSYGWGTSSQPVVVAPANNLIPVGR